MASQKHFEAAKVRLVRADWPPNRPLNDPRDGPHHESQVLQPAAADTNDDGATDGTSTTPSQFDLFPFLPQELQDRVWRMAALSVPRLYIIRVRSEYINLGSQRPLIAINPCQEVKERARKLKTLFLACKNARKEVLRTLPPPVLIASFPNRILPPCLGLLYFDVETDVLCFIPPLVFWLGRRFGPPPILAIFGGFWRIENFGLQTHFNMSPNMTLHAADAQMTLDMWAISMCFRLFFSAARFYLVAPPHVRNAPKSPKNTGDIL